MPIHVGPLSRRSFLAQGAATFAGLTVLRSGWGAAPDANPNLFALLSDTHVPASEEIATLGTNMTRNMRQVVREVAELPTRPAAVIINGDCAYLKGLTEDYTNFSDCIAPLREAGLPLHLTMGNHDHRERLYGVLQDQKPRQPLVDSRHLTVLETPRANWFLLDSLLDVDTVSGEIGTQQREWLAGALAARPEKPALVMAHHTPQFTPPPEGKEWNGLQDTTPFLDLLASHPQVKAFIYGHSHVWSLGTRGKIQLINLPPVAYVFKEGIPNGWVLAEVLPDGLSLGLRTIDPGHPQNGEQVTLKWS